MREKLHHSYVNVTDAATEGILMLIDTVCVVL